MKKRVNIIGGGPSALLLASELNPESFEVYIHEKNTAPGRKFLVAGHGGFNLTHSEAPEQFIQRYSPSSFLKKAFFGFTNHNLMAWLKARGIETRVGSSGRVFPLKGIKPIQVLDALLKHLQKRGVKVLYSREWMGFSAAGELLFKTKTGMETLQSEITVFCLGGASWPQTGSKGDWTNHFIKKGVTIIPFQASNCAFEIKWPVQLLSKIEGKAIKNAVFTCGKSHHAGEVVLTAFGIEGSGIYPLSPDIRKALENGKEAELLIDFKPGLSTATLFKKLQSKKSKGTYTQHVQKTLNLSDTQLALLKQYLSKDDFLNAERFVYFIKHFPLRISATGPISEAISSVGGIALEELNENFELKKIKNTYAIGEMLDYDAPTGGYLLQSCFSMAHALAKFLNAGS
ncbi:MAG: TIGR03862 family flavoprotein [Bacteroidia bacterium]|nr:TIGR03862 family flavoprotein [Bacteroidia bacterium]